MAQVPTADAKQRAIAALDSTIKELEEALAQAQTLRQRLGEDMTDQLSQEELQMAMSNHAEFLSKLSNVLKAMSDTDSAIAQNLK
jgi:hypothetical protein